MTAILLPPAGWAGVAIVWGFIGTAVWILLIALIVLIVRAIRTTARDPQVPAERVLEERYARGKISREEFLERRAVLDGTSPEAPR
jgi:uncharacterized membrane protein